MTTISGLVLETTSRLSDFLSASPGAVRARACPGSRFANFPLISALPAHKLLLCCVIDLHTTATSPLLAVALARFLSKNRRKHPTNGMKLVISGLTPRPTVGLCEHKNKSSATPNKMLSLNYGRGLTFIEAIC